MIEVIDTEIERDRTSDIQMVREYVKYERKIAFKEAGAWYVAFAVGLIFILFGLFFSQHFLLIIGLIASAIPSLILLRMHIAFMAYLRKWESQILKLGEKMGTFSFNSTGIKISTSDVTTEYKWSAISRFAENGPDVYLYDQRNELIEIVSVRFLHETEFEHFKELIRENITRPNTRAKSS